MLKTKREKAICERFSAIDENGKVHCSECPLVIYAEETICKATHHYDGKEWVLDD